jgi:rhodanese-related sulfurtransferase
MGKNGCASSAKVRGGLEVDEGQPVKGASSGVRRVTPGEAKSLLDLGYAYVDVRSVAEFDDLHPVGALNVPLPAPGQRGEPSSTAEFLTAMGRLFAKDAKIVIGCATGVRSLRAAEVLLGAGFTDVVEQRGGMEGARGPFGNLVVPGWIEAGLAVASGPDAGSFARLAARLGSATLAGGDNLR